MIPTFGDQSKSPTKLRKAAYAIILEDAKLAVVRGENGGYFLPGGGIDPGEVPQQALLREIQEECCKHAEIHSEIGEAIQFFSSKGHYLKMHVHVFLCSFTSAIQGKPEHTLFWMNPDEVPFFHESHRWAVNKVLKK